MIGVNLAGGEFGGRSDTKYGTDYIYPSLSSIDYYASKGMDVIRLPFDWERVQPTKNGAVNDAELARIDAIVDHARSVGITVVLDPHNYGKAYGGLIGEETSNAAFADFWCKTAAHFKNDGNVMFGLMNEPNKQSATDWIVSANAAIDAIRDSGATQKILVPGTYWDGAHSWVSSDNDTVVGAGVKDRLDNYAFEVHQYLDSNNSGTHANVVSETVGADRLKAVTAWAEATGHELFLGEFGVATDKTSLKALDTMLSYMDAHDDVWIGATYWAGGPWWGNYMYSIEPKNGVDKPQLAILQKYDLDGVSGTQPVPVPSAPDAPDPATPAGITGTAKADSLSGTSKADTMAGLGGDDLLKGFAGNDTLNGGDGADKLDGGSGADTMRGGRGNDVYVLENARDTVVEAANEGTDRVESFVSTTLGEHTENLSLRGGANLTGTGNALDNVLVGNGGANLIKGGAGADVLEGLGGADTLQGGAGADRFVFDSAADAKGDRVTDFDTGDVLDFRGFDAVPSTAKADGFTFIGEAAFTGKAGQLHLVFSGGNTLVQADLDGNGSADMSIGLTGLHHLGHDDFLL